MSQETRALLALLCGAVVFLSLGIAVPNLAETEADTMIALLMVWLIPLSTLTTCLVAKILGFRRKTSPRTFLNFPCKFCGAIKTPNVQGQGRCEASSRSAPWSEVLGRSITTRLNVPCLNALDREWKR